MYKMRFYNVEGNIIGEVENLTIEQVNTIYNGCSEVLKRDTGKVFNACMPTVWDENGARVMGY
jgi:hypothetical protein